MLADALPRPRADARPRRSRRRSARLEGAFALAVPLRGRGRPDDRRPPGLAARHRPRRRRDVRGLRRHRARALHRPHHLSRGGRLGRLTRAGATIRDRDGRLARPRRDAPSPPTVRRVDKGGHQHFMAKEIAEQPAAIADALGPLPRRRRASALPGARHRLGRHRPAVDGRLRHRLLCRRWSRKYWFEQLARPALRGRRRLRVPLPRAARPARHRSRSSSASRARPPTRSPRCATARAGPARSLSVVNVAESSHRPRERPRAADPRRAARSASPRPRPSPASSRSWRSSRSTPRRARGRLDAAGLGRAARRARRAARPREPRARRSTADARRIARDLAEARGHPLPRPRADVSAGPRRRAEAQGNQLHPRRRLCIGRAEARPHRAGGQGGAGDRPGARTTSSSTRPSRTCRR